MTLLSETFFWINRNKYRQLMKDFIDKKINAVEFDTQFSMLSSRDTSLYWQTWTTTTIEPDSRAKGFESLISNIFLTCNDFNVENDETILPYMLDEEGLRLEVKKMFPRIEKYCNES